MCLSVAVRQDEVVTVSLDQEDPQASVLYLALLPLVSRLCNVT